MEEKKIDIIIPVYKEGKEFRELIGKLLCQTVLPEHIFILQTVTEEKAMLSFDDDRVFVYPVKREEFDHGGTRDFGVKLSKADYVLMMTQDAMPEDDNLLAELLKGFALPNVGIVFGRQLARKDADITEQLTRLHNYPEKSCLKTRADVEKLGIKTYFCSDVCAMYQRELYESLGGFVHPAIFNEDMIMAYKVIHAGYGVYYAADAKVIHSHSYTCMQQFHRNFDLGVSQSQNSDIFDNISSEKEGAGFAKKVIMTLCKKGHPFKAVYFALQCGFRLAGFKLGKNYERLSRRMLLRCTMSPWYWKEDR